MKRNNNAYKSQASGLNNDLALFKPELRNYIHYKSMVSAFLFKE